MKPPHNLTAENAESAKRGNGMCVRFRFFALFAFFAVKAFL